MFGYTTRVVSEKTGASPGAASGTVKEVTVQTTMNYVVEVGAGYLPYDGQRGGTSVNYNYVLELNSTGDIIGGKWLTRERPDFLWMMSAAPLSALPGLNTIYSESIR